MKNLKSSLIVSIIASIIFCVLIYIIENITLSSLIIQGSIFFVFMFIGEFFIFQYFDKKSKDKKDKMESLHAYTYDRNSELVAAVLFFMSILVSISFYKLGFASEDEFWPVAIMFLSCVFIPTVYLYFRYKLSGISIYRFLKYSEENRGVSVRGQITIYVIYVLLSIIFSIIAIYQSIN